MATITELPKNITREQVEALRDAYDYFYNRGNTLNFKDPKTKIHFEKPENLIDELWKLGVPKNTSLKYIGITLENWYEKVATTPEFKGAEESTAPANMPTELKEKIKAEEKVSAELKQTRVQASAEVQTAIDKQKEIYAEEIQKAKEVETALKGKKIYYKVKNAPEKFIEDAAKQFAENPNLKELTVDEARVASVQAAVTAYDTLIGNSPMVSIAVANNIVANPAILGKIAPDAETQTRFRNIVQEFVDKANARAKLTGQLTNVAKANGFVNPEEIAIQLSETPQVGFREFDFNQQVVSPHIEDLGQQNIFLNNLTGLGEGEIKSQFLSFAGKRLENYIASLPVDSVLAQKYNQELVQLGLTSLGIVEAAPWVATEGTRGLILGNIITGSGLGPVAGFIQAKTGINLGVKVAEKAVEKAAVSVGTEAATGTGLAASITALFAWTGPLAPVIGAVGAFLVDLVGIKLVGWIKDHINWKWIKEKGAAIGAAIVGIPLTIFGAITGSTGLILAGGVITGAGIAASSGVTLAGAASGVAGFFSAIGGAFIGSVATPILITLLGFPVAVTLILFIINSGAYVVPPGANLASSLSSTSTAGGGPPVTCSLDKAAIPFPNTASPGIAYRAWQITADLYQGFWCFWNRSPKAPPPYDKNFPNDTVDYPPSYPSLFDYALYLSNPNPPDDNGGLGLNLFWCTDLIVKSYLEEGNRSITATNPLWVPNLYDDFTRRGKIVSGSTATASNFPSGSVVFFYIPGDSVPEGHVGIVYLINPDGFYFVQSNAPTKSGFINFNQSGTGIPTTVFGWTVVGIGLP